MQADHVLRSVRGVGNGIQVQVGGVAGEHGAGPGDGTDAREYLLLDPKVFEHGLDHQISLGQCAPVQAWA